MKRCATCSKPITLDYQGHREKVYCSDACRQKAYRQRDKHTIKVKFDMVDPEREMLNRTIEMLQDGIKTLRDNLQWYDTRLQEEEERNERLESHQARLRGYIDEKDIEIVRLNTLLEGKTRKRGS